MNTYIIGAGASHSYNLSPTNIVPPLAKNFFNAYKDLDISSDLNVLIFAILNYLKEKKGIDSLDFLDWNENIENFLTEIESDLLSKTKLVKKDAISFADFTILSDAYNQLIFLFEGVLNEIQNGPVCNYYSKLVDKLSNNDTIISFNWDTLLDRALWEKTDWSPNGGYGLKFNQYYDNEWTKNTSINKSSLSLLKLHGSTNWIMPYIGYTHNGVRTSDYYDLEKEDLPIFCYIQSTNKYETFKDRCKIGYQPFSYYYYPPNLPLLPDKTDRNQAIITTSLNMSFQGTTFDVKQTQLNNKTTSMPLIIPPVRHKNYNILGNIFNNLWNQALLGLIKSDKVIIIGYSFPITDTKSWDLLKEAQIKRLEPLNIEIVDPYPDQLLSRLYNEFGSNINCTANRSTFADYIY